MHCQYLDLKCKIYQKLLLQYIKFQCKANISLLITGVTKICIVRHGLMNIYITLGMTPVNIILEQIYSNYKLSNTFPI